VFLISLHSLAVFRLPVLTGRRLRASGKSRVTMLNRSRARPAGKSALPWAWLPRNDCSLVNARAGPSPLARPTSQQRCRFLSGTVAWKRTRGCLFGYAVNHFGQRFKPLNKSFPIDYPGTTEAILWRAGSCRISALECLIVQDN